MSDLNMEPQRTEGQNLIETPYNPDKTEEVAKIKEAFSTLVDLCLVQPSGSYLRNLLKDLAIQSLLTSQMAMVKLFTFNK